MADIIIGKVSRNTITSFEAKGCQYYPMEWNSVEKGRIIHYIFMWTAGVDNHFVEIVDEDINHSEDLGKIGKILEKLSSKEEEESDVVYSMADEKYIYKLTKQKGDENERRKYTKYQGNGSTRVKERESRGSQGAIEGALLKEA